MTEANNAAPLLSVTDLEISFGRGKKQVRCTDHVSFDVYPGEILALVGESGCGKSITALSILGLLSRQGHVTGGSIRFDGTDLLALQEKQLDEIRGRGIAMIFQDIMYSLNPVFTIGNQMTEGMRRHLGMSREEAKREAVSLLEKTGIRDAQQVMRKYPHQLSGGQRQRVMIAMALSCKPRLLIADEPTTALDVTIQLQIMELLRSLRDEYGMAILLITHDIGVVAELADRVNVMYAGQCVEQAPVDTLLTDPAHPYTQALLKAVPGLHDDRAVRLYSIPGSVPERYDTMTGCHFAPRCPYAAECPGGYEALQRMGEQHLCRCNRYMRQEGVKAHG
ncbi:MAG: ABC transporter ATP-binding protein [Clostridia bacterium]|nr:ABC transporter ATP-binding protein [Clostridia bacterium]